MTKKLAIVLPRGSRFCENKPTALDICIQNLNVTTDFEIEVFCLEDAEKAIDTFPSHYPDAGIAKKQKLNNLIEKIKAFNPDIIEVQQHLSSAAKIADAFSDVPVYLHKHFYIKKNKFNFISNFKRKKQLEKLSGIVFVAQHLRNRFKVDYPTTLKKSSYVLYNSINFKAPVDFKLKKNQIIFAGRANDDKGALEFLESLPLVFESSEYNARFVTAMYEGNKTYNAKIQAMYDDIEKRYPGRLNWEQNLKHAEVLEAFAESKIAVFPSKFPEGFALVAIEGQLAGLAIVSSQSPGLKEVHGDNALYVNEVTGLEISEKLLDLVLSENKLNQLANNAQARVNDNFSLEKQNKILNAIRVTLLNRG